MPVCTLVRHMRTHWSGKGCWQFLGRWECYSTHRRRGAAFADCPDLTQICHWGTVAGTNTDLHWWLPERARAVRFPYRQPRHRRPRCELRSPLPIMVPRSLSSSVAHLYVASRCPSILLREPSPESHPSCRSLGRWMGEIFFNLFCLVIFFFKIITCKKFHNRFDVSFRSWH